MTGRAAAPEDAAVYHVPAVLLCVAAVWFVVLALVLLRLLAGHV